MKKNVDVFDYLQRVRRQQIERLPWMMEQPELSAGPPPEVQQRIDDPLDIGAVGPTPEETQISQEATADIQMGAITLEMIIDKFNAIRSGRSFKEKSIKQQMLQYFERLTDEEKISLYAFMKGIAQIVTGEFMGYQPVTPSSVDATQTSPPPAAESPAEGAPEAPATPPPSGVPPAPSPPVAEAPPPPPAPPVKKVIKTIKPNIIKRQLPPTNASGVAAPIPITPKVRK